MSILGLHHVTATVDDAQDDLDFCLTAHTRGLALGTTNVYLSHPSTGDFDTPTFREAQTVFRAKWAGGGA